MIENRAIKYKNLSVIGIVLISINLFLHILATIINIVIYNSYDSSIVSTVFSIFGYYYNIVFSLFLLLMLCFEYNYFCRIRNMKLLTVSACLGLASCFIYSLGLINPYTPFSYSFYSLLESLPDFSNGIFSADFFESLGIGMMALSFIFISICELICYMSIGFLVYHKKVLKGTNKTNIAKRYENFRFIPPVLALIPLLIFLIYVIVNLLA